MGSQNADQITLGPSAIYIGTKGVTPATSLGYTDEDGCSWSTEPELLEVKTGQKTAVVKRLITGQKATIKCNLLQVTLEALAAVIPGCSTATNEVYINPETTAVNEISVAIVGLSPDGYPRRVEMLYATATGNVEDKMAAGELDKIPAEFSGIATSDRLISIRDGSASMVQTLASGVLTRTTGAGYHQVGGESSAADALTSITGSSLTDGELLILQIYSTAQPITVTHASGTLELEGDVNWIMTKRGDALYLRYDEANTAWVEVGRYDDPS